MLTNTNNMRHNFEAAASTLIEVDPYKRDRKLPYDLGIQANISDVDFSGGRVSSGVDICCHHTKYFKKLYKYQKDELADWMHSIDINKLIKASRKAARTDKRKGSGSGKEGDKKPEVGGNWKNKSKQVMKTPRLSCWC